MKKKALSLSLSLCVAIDGLNLKSLLCELETGSLCSCCLSHHNTVVHVMSYWRITSKSSFPFCSHHQPRFRPEWQSSTKLPSTTPPQEESELKPPSWTEEWVSVRERICVFCTVNEKTKKNWKLKSVFKVEIIKIGPRFLNVRYLPEFQDTVTGASGQIWQR